MHIFDHHKPDTVINIEGDLVINIGEERPQRLRPKLAFNYLITNTNFTTMPQVTNLTLTSTAPVTLNMTVVDANKNNTLIAGVLSNLSYAPQDVSQDVAVVDPTNLLEVDVHAVSNSGGTTVVGTGTFVSTLTTTNPDGSTSPAFSGTVTGQLVLVNNIPVAILNPVLAFNQ